jgi:lysozyme
MATKRQLGVDLSHWQGEGGLSGAKWDKLVECKVRWAILKATQGTGHVDDAFGTNLRRARKRGLEVGAYHFLIRGNGAGQARHFIRTVKRANHGKLKDVLLVVDVERDPAGHSPRASDARAFLRELRKLAKRTTRLVYSSAGYWHSIGNPDLTALCDGLWQARWDGKRHTCKRPNLPARPPRAGFGGWSGRPPMWQYGSFRYGAGRMDGNALYLSESKMRDLFRTAKPKPAPEPKPIPDRVRYREGYNAMVEEAIEALPDVDDPEPKPGVAWPAGVAEAREDIGEAIAALRIGKP